MTIRPDPTGDAWKADAACRGLDPDLFFPERGESTKEAKRVCLGDPRHNIPACPVRDECCAKALTLREGSKPMPGIWGGTSERERRLLRRGRPKRQAAWYETDPAKEIVAMLMLDAGHSYEEISIQIHVGRQAIRNWIVRRRNGLTATSAPDPDEEVA